MEKLFFGIASVMILIGGIIFAGTGVVFFSVDLVLFGIIGLVGGAVFIILGINFLLLALDKKEMKYGSFELGMTLMLFGGLLFVGVGAQKVIVTSGAMINGVKTTAEITNMMADGTVYVSYYAEEQHYSRVSLGERDSTMYEGKLIKVAYYPEIPTRVYLCDFSAIFSPLAMMLMGMVFAYIGGKLLFDSLFPQKCVVSYGDEAELEDVGVDK